MLSKLQMAFNSAFKGLIYSYSYRLFPHRLRPVYIYAEKTVEKRVWKQFFILSH